MPEINSEYAEILDEIVDKIIADKGATELSEKDKATLKEVLRGRLDEMIDEEMIEAIPDEQIIMLDERMKAGMTDEEMAAFLENSGADFDEAAVRAIQRLRRDVLGEDETMTNVAGDNVELPAEDDAVEKSAGLVAGENNTMTNTTNGAGEEK